MGFICIKLDYHGIFLACTLSLLYGVQSRARADSDTSLKTEVVSELGSTIQSKLDSPSLEHVREYFYQKISQDLFHSYGVGKWTAAYRGRIDLKTDFEQGKNTDLTLRTLTFDWASGIFQMRAGVQDVSWGESFGFNVIDVVNARDVTEPIFTEDSETKIPVAMLSEQVFLGSWNFQGIYIPLPARSPLPQFHNNFPIQKPDKYKIGVDAEYGFKTGYLFDFGLDANLFAFNHWNRTPVFLIVNYPSNPEFISPSYQVQSYGASFSQAFNSVVLRTDVAFHNNLPLSSTPAQQINLYKQWQSIFGADVTSLSQTTLGLQIFIEHSVPKEKGEKYHLFQLAGVRLQGKMLDGLFENQLVVFSGFNVRDLWINPEITWNVSPGWRIIAAAHVVKTPKNGYLERLALQNTFQTKLIFRF